MGDQNKKSSTVPFDEEAVKKYLDGCITHWRTKRITEMKQGPAANKEVVDMCVYYIDAFQSVRVSLFGELKP